MQSVAAGGSSGELADELVVIGMRTDPEPHEAAVWTVDAKNAVVESDSARPEAADPLEVERRMMWAGFQESVLLVGQALNCKRERAIARPEPGGREVLQISVHLPDL